MEKDSHLTNKPILINCPSRFPLGKPRSLRPHLLDVLEKHIAMAIERFDTGEKLAVVAQGDENFVVRRYRRLQDGQGAGAEFMGFKEGDFVLGQVGAGLGEEVSERAGTAISLG